jgi:DNA-binding SARP family transcriptional activator
MTTLAADAVPVLGDAAPALSVLGGFQLRSRGAVVPLPSNAQRVLGLLAISGTSQRRDVLAGQLWSNLPQERAQANLRTAVWRVRQRMPDVVDCSRDNVDLAAAVTVDYHVITSLAGRLLHRDLAPEELRRVPFGLLATDLLPGWDEDWLIIDREQHRLLRMHALESLSTQLTDIAEYGLAVACAYAAIRIEPLCESATHALLRACLAEGNRAEALRQFHLFRHLLADETGLGPSPQLMDLMSAVLPGAGEPPLSARRTTYDAALPPDSVDLPTPTRPHSDRVSH